MCGRYSLTPAALELLPLLFEMDPKRMADLAGRYNVAPTQRIPTVRQGEDGRELAIMRWGLIPVWTKDPKKSPLLINARSESVAEKPAFRASFKARRCLVPADGFFEWEKLEKAKQPIYFQLRDKQPFAFAGLWDRWQGPEGPVDSCTLITTQANELVSGYHDRMPVILPREAFDAWLDLEQHDPAALQPMLAPYPAREMIATRVNPRVNSATHDDPACIEPI
jgi:putative SOS response-associated peptidase YedK